MKENGIKIRRANEIVKNYMLGTLGVGILPIPVLDLVALTAIQLKMVHSLARLYDQAFSRHLGKSLIVSLVGGCVPVSFSLNLSAFKNFIPFYGPAARMIFMSIFAGASTLAVGRVFIQHFESGGTLLTFDPEKEKDNYAAQLQKGKDEVRSGFAGVKP